MPKSQDEDVLAGPPERDVPVPEVVLDLAAGRQASAVWLNELGGLTFKVGSGSDCCYLKWTPAGSDLDLTGEAARMRWVRPFSRVPDVIDVGHDGKGSWLMTAPLPGQSAVSDPWKQQPEIAMRAIGMGLRHLHDHAPVDGCPFSWSAAERVTRARQRAEDGRADPRAWHPTHHELTIAEALSIIDDAPPIDSLVVCQGDACAPNTMIDEGRWSGHVDLGSLGVADRWADLAIATWSTEWNYGPGWERALLDAYGTDPDAERTAYYRLLWDLT